MVVVAPHVAVYTRANMVVEGLRAGRVEHPSVPLHCSPPTHTLSTLASTPQPLALPTDNNQPHPTPSSGPSSHHVAVDVGDDHPLCIRRYGHLHAIRKQLQVQVPARGCVLSAIPGLYQR